MARAREHVSLTGFDRDEVASFIAARAGVNATDSVVSRLFDATEGHPFFLDELVRVLKAGGELAGDGEPEVRGRLPEGVRAAIRQRLTPLSVPERQILDLAAVIGRSFGLDALELACELPPAAILENLSGAIASGVVEERPDGPAQFRFAHALIREAIYGDQLPATRALAHRKVALALERRAAGSVDPPLAELAHHFYFSAALGDAGKAVDYAARAAARALELGAHEESVAHYQRALQAMAMQPPDEARQLELRLALGSSLWRAGKERQARDTFHRAADAARVLGDAGRAGARGDGLQHHLGADRAGGRGAAAAARGGHQRPRRGRLGAAQHPACRRSRCGSTSPPSASARRSSRAARWRSPSGCTIRSRSRSP